MRRLLGTRKVGHAGTLDPMATGVLLVGVERATRLLGYLSRTDKSYTATIRLGFATTTDDAEGEPIELPAGHLHGADGLDVDPTEADVESAMAALRGPLQQVPSSVSAIKVDGVRSYARVRAGDEVDLPARPVTVHRFELLDRRQITVGELRCLDLDVVVDCSTGTYVRALARDLGTRLGTGGHLVALRRTRVGDYDLGDAIVLDPAPDPIPVLPLSTVAGRTFAVLELDDGRAAAVRHGRRLPDLTLPGDPTALFDQAGTFLALYRPAAADAVPDAVFVG